MPDRDPPDHMAYTPRTAEFHVTTWGNSGEVHIAFQGDPLEPIRASTARELAAALLAAARVAEGAEK